MKIATWNVNSLRVRLPHVLDWLGEHDGAVLALQETKVVDGAFPIEEIGAAGYRAAFTGERTYNGVALLSRAEPGDVVERLPGADGDQKRFLAATIGGVRVVCVYVPNGQDVGTEKYAFKLRWLERLRDHLAEERKRHEQLVVLGDFNVAPADLDVYDPEEWRGRILCSDPERAAFHALLDTGLVDLFRHRDGESPGFTWWDYRQFAFRRNRGLRIDHLLVTPELAEACDDCFVDVEPRKRERPSDHTPVVGVFRVD